jgi:chromosomal replication initiator protein
MLSEAEFARNKILAVVADHFNLTVEEIRGRRRFRRFSTPRHVAAWIMRRAGHGLADIGQQINRDHSTAYYGVQVILKMRADDPKFAAEIDELEGRACGE